MNHEQFTEWLYLSVFDELSEDENHLLEAHLRICGQVGGESFQFLWASGGEKEV